MEHHAGDNEPQEEQDLYGKPNCDYVRTSGHIIRCLIRDHDGANSLRYERCDIAEYEDLCQPTGSHRRMAIRLHDAHHST
jgi:hypothetical protein